MVHGHADDYQKENFPTHASRRGMSGYNLQKHLTFRHSMTCIYTYKVSNQWLHKPSYYKHLAEHFSHDGYLEKELVA